MSISSITSSASGYIVVQGTGTPYQTFTVEAKTDLSAGFITVGSATAGNDRKIMFVDASAANFTRRFYRFVYP